jgi:hypothetical protein
MMMVGVGDGEGVEIRLVGGMANPWCEGVEFEGLQAHDKTLSSCVRIQLLKWINSLCGLMR